MQKKIDLKSTVLGVALGTILVLSVSAATTPSASCGRYQLAVSELAGYAPAIYKIDTATGQVWKSNAAAPTADFMAPVAGN